MTKLKITTLTVLILLGSSLAGIGVSRFNASAQDSSATLDKPTQIRKGVKTSRQKEHGKLYKGLGDVSNNIDDKLNRTDGELLLVTEVGTPFSIINEPPFNLSTFLAKQACDADAIIIGSPKRDTSQLTEDEGFIFTDYDVTVEQVIKDNSIAPIQPKSVITVTRQGGSVILNGKIIRAVDKNFRQFSDDGRYLLFLKYIPTTGAYQALPDASYELYDKKITGLDPSNRATKVTDDLTSFINMVNTAAAGPCASAGNAH